MITPTTPNRAARVQQMDATENEYWVEARRAVKDPDRVIGYGVWHINAIGARERVSRYAVTRRGGWEIALLLANRSRDRLNKAKRG